MKRSWIAALMLIAAPASASAADWVIPYVLAGSTVYIQNSGDSDMSVTAEFNGINQTKETVQLVATRKSTSKITAPSGGHLKLTAPSGLTAWTVIEGATFQAVALTGLQLSATVKRESGLSLANPWDEDVPVSFTVYVNGGAYVASLSGVLVRRQTLSVIAGTLIREMLEDLDYVVSVHATKPLALGVAQPSARGGFEYVPVAVSGGAQN